MSYGERGEGGSNTDHVPMCEVYGMYLSFFSNLHIFLVEGGGEGGREEGERP